MVEWKRRVLTGAIAVPALFFLLHYKATTVIIVHSIHSRNKKFIFNKVVIFLAQKEYRILLKSTLEANSPEAVSFYIHSLGSSYVNVLV